MAKLRQLDVGDLHCPFEHRDAWDFLAAVNKRFRPDVVICKGDELDSHGLSDHDHDPSGRSAGDELEEGLKHLANMYSLFPECYVCESNHTSRVYRRAMKHGIPRQYLRDYSDFMRAPKGWRWAESWIFDNVFHEHGDPESGKDAAITRALANMMHTSIGHVHGFAGVSYRANRQCLLWGMNVGCLIDRRAYAMAYARKMKVKPTLGVGEIDCGVPRWQPMWLDRAGRWTGRL